MFKVAQDDPNINFLESLLESCGDWATADQIIAVVRSRTGARWHDRQVRALASASGGRIASGQKGYRLTLKMTKDEADHFCNWMLGQSDKMRRRVIEFQKVFYSRKPVAVW